MQDSGDQVNKNAIGTILIRCQLNLHRPELHSPTDVVVNRNLEPHWVPVGAIEHVEQGELILRHVFEVLMDDEIVSSKDVGQVEN